MKNCTKCKINKNLSEYGMSSRNRDGLDTKCKQCRKLHKQNYKNSINGLITNMYYHQCYHSKGRGHKQPEYNKQQLKEWLFSQNNFKTLYDNWKNSGYIKELLPSVDRIRDLEHYKIDNIQLMTFKENNKKAHKDRLNGEHASGQICKAINQYSKDGDFIKEYHSSYEAQRQTGVAQQNIGKCCLNKRPLAGGYMWKYK